MNRSRARGTAWETAVVAYLNAHGFPHAERRALRGKDDRGDIAGIPGVILECKAVREFELGAWMTETDAERVRDGAQVGAVVVKRRQRPVADAYVVLPLAQFVTLIGEP